MKHLLITLVFLISVVMLLPAAEISDEQRAHLEYMYEEEKMARDIYAALGEIWNLRIFGNISQAEEQHMSRIADIASEYDLNLPELSEGEFYNSEIRELYDSLMARGSTGPNEALEVGRIVEITDIADLESILEAGMPEDVSRILERLLSGSENHLSAFNRQLGI